MNLYVLISLISYTNRDKVVIKKLLLDFGIQFSQLEVIDISEKCAMSWTKVDKVIKEMISNGEINASYYRKKKAIDFDKEANIKEIDHLLGIYEKWEAEIYEKKEK
jgi:polyhydroxyalkanoate synthesis regulator phasin